MPRGAITVVPGGGLCNRMVTLDSALALGRVLDRPVHVLWKLGRALNCRFHRLFEPLPGVARVSHVHNNQMLGMFSLRLRQKLADLRGADTWWRDEIYGLRQDPTALLERARRSRELRIRADTRFFADGPLFAGFRPAPALAARIASAAHDLSDAVGVHVRRTDHADAIRLSPLTAFVEALHDELRRAPGTRIFASTDDPEVLRVLRAEFGDALRHNPPTAFDRLDPRAIENAVVDLWCLASCRLLFGSHGSTFSKTAWQLKGIPHRIVGAGPEEGQCVASSP